MVEDPMTGSRFQKLWKIARAGVRSPLDAWQYFQHLPAWHRSLIDLELPWFSYGAIHFLQHWLRPHHRIFEYGGGGSSIFFARNSGTVLSVEGEAEWHRRILQAASFRGLANLRCELHPLNDANAEEYRRNPYFHAIGDDYWDVVVIDCYCGFATGGPGGRLRPYAFDLALSHVANGGLVVLDDFWMFPELMRSRPGVNIHRFIGLGPSNYGLKATAIFEFT